MTSSVSVMSSPSFDSLAEPQQGQFVGAAMTTRSRGRCSGNGFRDGRLRSKALTVEALGCHLRRQFVFAGISFEFFELQFHLFEKPRLALERLP